MLKHPAPVEQRIARSAPEIIVLAISTGGPQALRALCGQLPPQLSVPLVIVQHMPADFTRMLAEQLSLRTTLPVAEAAEGGIVRPGCVWIAPGNHHLELVSKGSRVVFHTHQGPHENSCRPSADLLFCSAAEIFGPRVLGVVMTGMGKDGLRGCRAIHAAGGQVVAQDRETSVVWGMPGAVAQAGLADAVLPLDEIAAEIAHRAQSAERIQTRRKEHGR